MLPVSRPSIGEEELAEIEKVFATGWLGLGSTVFEFENQVKQYLGAENVIAVNTGTSALHIALDGFGITAGDEVIVPSLTFCADIQAITALGAAPVFCEVDPDTLNVDPNDIRERITPRTRAIMPVHYRGQVCDMDALLDIAGQHNLIVIEDAAHAFGSSYKGQKVGSFGHAACFSFDPIKNLTCGEGGAVVLQDNDIAEQIRRKRILGIDKDTWHRYRNQRTWFYEVTTQGYRYHMSNINAAIGLAQLKKLDRFLDRKRALVASYNQKLADLTDIQVIDMDLDQTAPFTYIIKVLNGRRDQAIPFLAERGVGAGVHYIANHIQPFFAPYAEPMPVTEKLWKQILTLPLHAEMTEADVDTVVSALTDFTGQTP